MEKKTLTIEQEKVQELYNVLTNYPAISKEQVIMEMNKCFGEKAFKPIDVTERIKTFEDACAELGENHKLVMEYERQDDDSSSDLLAYLKLRIVCAALNEGWEPQHTEDEVRWYPWHWLYTQDEIDELDLEERSDRHMMTTGDYQTGYAGFACAYSNHAPSRTTATIGSRLCLKNRDLAIYCGKQFINLWANFKLIRR